MTNGQLSVLTGGKLEYGTPWSINPGNTLQTLHTKDTYVDRDICVVPVHINASDIRKGVTVYGTEGTFDYPCNPSDDLKSTLNLWIETE